MSILYVAFQETLMDDFEELKRTLSLEKNLSLPTSPIDAHRNPKYEIPKLTDSQATFFKSWFANDYEIYDYCKKKYGK
jgi:hypothetical protein